MIDLEMTKDEREAVSELAWQTFQKMRGEATGDSVTDESVYMAGLDYLISRIDECPPRIIKSFAAKFIMQGVIKSAVVFSDAINAVQTMQENYERNRTNATGAGDSTGTGTESVG